MRRHLLMKHGAKAQQNQGGGIEKAISRFFRFLILAHHTNLIP
jgi:hypothetical protein